jgi:hypothetical protein
MRKHHFEEQTFFALELVVLAARDKTLRLGARRAGYFAQETEKGTYGSAKTRHNRF